MPLEIMKADQMQDGELKLCTIGGKELTICRSAGKFYAIEAVCPHRGAILAQGHLEGDTIVCPWHDWDFDIKTGKGVTNPHASIETFRIEEQNGGVVLLDANPPPPGE